MADRPEALDWLTTGYADGQTIVEIRDGDGDTATLIGPASVVTQTLAVLDALRGVPDRVTLRGQVRQLLDVHGAGDVTDLDQLADAIATLVHGRHGEGADRG